MHLTRKLADRRQFPAIDIERTSTRREELMLSREVLSRVWTLRRMIDALGGGADAVEPVLDRLAKTRSNAEFLANLSRDGS